MRWPSFRRILVAVVTVAAFVAAWLLAGPASAAALGGDPVAQEHELLALMNAERAAAGARPLAMQADLVAAARTHAAAMRGRGGLYHDLAGKQATAPLGWNRLGENVGNGGSVTSLHAAFMASPSHAVNVLQREFSWAGVGIVHDDQGRIWVVIVFMAHPSLTSSSAGSPGSAPAPAPRPAPVAPVGTATVPGGRGYWRVTSNGGVFAHDGAPFFGSAAGIRLRRPIVGIAATPSGKGYWLVASDGGIFSFGDARFHGSTGALTLNQPIVGMAATPAGNGYWLVAADGGVFTFGAARFHGSTGNMLIGSPMQRMVAGPTGAGYWLIAANRQLYPFGEAGPRPTV